MRGCCCIGLCDVMRGAGVRGGVIIEAFVDGTEVAEHLFGYCGIVVTRFVGGQSCCCTLRQGILPRSGSRDSRPRHPLCRRVSHNLRWPQPA